MVTNQSLAAILAVILLAIGIIEQASFLNLSQDLISYHASAESHAPTVAVEAWKVGASKGRNLQADGDAPTVNFVNESFIEGASTVPRKNKINAAIQPKGDETNKVSTVATERTKVPTNESMNHQPKPTSAIHVSEPPKQQAIEDTAEPKDEPMSQVNPDDQRVEISLDDAAREPEQPYGALKMIEEAETNIIKLAKENAYKKFSISPPKPMLAESVPFRHFSHIHYVGIAGLGHRLVRHAAAVYIGRCLGFAVRGYWSKYNDIQDGTKDLFLELFDTFTRDEFAFVNSTNRTIRFYNGVQGMKGPAQHCSSSRQNGICRQQNSHAIECKKCGCTNDEIQVHYDFYKALRDKYTRRHLVSAFMNQNNFSSHTVLGIHIRGGNGEGRDFTFKKRGIHHDPNEYVAALIQVIRDTIPIDSLQKPPLIFIATDQAIYRKLVADEIKSQNLSWPVVVLEQEFAKSGVILYGHARHKEKWHSMFQDMVLLSYSDVLIATKYSSFTQAIPMSLVLGRPESERTVKDGYCEVIDENDNGSIGGAGPLLRLYCYHSYMQNCCGTSNKVHRKVTKFLDPRYRGQPINVTIEDFYPRQYFSFEDSLGRFVWNVSKQAADEDVR